jgi:hypothetical protein
MPNWATLFTQRSRLPTVPAGVDPRTDWFHCEKYAANLTRVACINRHKLARGRTQDGLSYQATLYGGCHRCAIGAAHAAGLPTPSFQLPAQSSGGHMEESTMTTPTNGHAIRTWPDRTCAKCKQSFTPQTARERRCAECTAAAPAPKAGAAPKRRGRPKASPKLARSSRGNGTSAHQTVANGRAPAAFVDVAPSEVVTTPNGKSWTPKPLSATTNSGVLKPSQIATASELLELAGYKVQTVHTPAGEFLRVL